MSGVDLVHKFVHHLIDLVAQLFSLVLEACQHLVAKDHLLL